MQTNERVTPMSEEARLEYLRTVLFTRMPLENTTYLTQSPDFCQVMRTEGFQVSCDWALGRTNVLTGRPSSEDLRDHVFGLAGLCTVLTVSCLIQ